MFFGPDWSQAHKLEYAAKYRPQDVHCNKALDGRLQDCALAGTVKPKVVGPVGWHLMSLVSG